MRIISTCAYSDTLRQQFIYLMMQCMLNNRANVTNVQYCEVNRIACSFLQVYCTVNNHGRMLRCITPINIYLMT